MKLWDRFLDVFARGAIRFLQWCAERVSPILVRRYPVDRTLDIPIPGWDGNTILADLYVPRGPRPETGWPLLYVIHGGGFRFFSKRSHAAIAAKFASQGYLALVPEYRLAPEHPFPAALKDVLAVFDWAHRSLAEYGGSLESCVVSGESAGGNLALCLTLAALGFEEYSEWKPAGALWKVPRKIIVNCGALKLLAEDRIRSGRHSRIVQQRFRRIQHDYLPQSLDGTQASRWEMAEPLTILERRIREAGRLPEQFPEALIPVGGEDPVLEDSKQLGRVLARGGARGYLRVYPKSTHGFYIMPWDRNAAVCWRDIGNFIAADPENRG